MLYFSDSPRVAGTSSLTGSWGGTGGDLGRSLNPGGLVSRLFCGPCQYGEGNPVVGVGVGNVEVAPCCGETAQSES